MRWLALVLAGAIGCSRQEAAPPSEPTTSSSQAAMSSPTAARDDSPTTAIDPPAPAVEAEPPSSKPTSSNPPGRDFDDVQGLTAAELVAHWGEPDSKAGSKTERWTYKFPRTGCVDEQLVYVLSLRAGRVTNIERSTEQTGKVCGSIE